MMAHQSPWQSWWRWGMEKDQCYYNILFFHLRPSKLKVTEDFFFSFSWIQFHVGKINKQTGNVCGLSVRESVGYLLGLQVGWVGFQLNPTWILSTYLRQTKQKGKKKKNEVPYKGRDCKSRDADLRPTKMSILTWDINILSLSFCEEIVICYVVQEADQEINIKWEIKKKKKKP